MTPRIGALLTHPIQYYSPFLAHLARNTSLKVYYAHRQSAEGQARAGFGTAFEWDVPLLEGYDYCWLTNVARHPGLDRFDGCDTPEIADILRRERFDALIMMGWNRKCYIQAGWAAWRAKTPTFIRLDSQLETRRPWGRRALRRLLYPAILPFAADYLSPGRRSDAYLRHFSVPERRIHRLPHMIDTERFANGSAAAIRSGKTTALRHANGADEKTFVFVFIAKMIAQKRPRLLLEAMSRLCAQAPATNVQLWMVGDGPLADDLRARAAAEGLPVRFLGFVNQASLPAVYAASDCLVSNSEETWGLVVNEAFACGVPAIVSWEAGCAPDMIIEGETGWVMRYPDAATLARLMARALDEARDLPREKLAALTYECSYEVGVKRIIETIAKSQGQATEFLRHV